MLHAAFPSGATGDRILGGSFGFPQGTLLARGLKNDASKELGGQRRPNQRFPQSNHWERENGNSRSHDAHRLCTTSICTGLTYMSHLPRQAKWSGHKNTGGVNPQTPKWFVTRKKAGFQNQAAGFQSTFRTLWWTPC